MGCTSSHSVQKIEFEQRLTIVQKTIDHMKSQIESQVFVIEDIETRQQAMMKQFAAQVNEHVSLCADFKTFIDIARENEQMPQEIIERIEILETKIASVVNDELNKVKEQLHNLESSALLDESNPRPYGVLEIASQLQNVQQKVCNLEMQLLSDERAADFFTNVSGDSADEESGQGKTDYCSDGNASEEALETLFMKTSPNLNTFSSSTHDYDVAGVLDFTLLEPEDAFEAEISSIAARVHLRTRLMKSQQCYPSGFEERSRNDPISSNLQVSLNGSVRDEESQVHLSSRRNMHVATKLLNVSKTPVLVAKPKEGCSSDASDS